MQNTKHTGFTLIELTIVLVIIAILTVPMISFLRLYQLERVKNITLENMNTASYAIAKFYQENGRYPCPASFTETQGDESFGFETSCSPGAEKSTFRTVRANFDSASGIGADGVFEVNVDDTDGDGQADQIVIGALPHKTLGIPVENILDGYSNKITYAVTARNTVQGGYHLGAIDIIDHNGESVIKPDKSAQFIIISHGYDGKGSFTSSGRLNGVSCIGSNHKDAENCDSDETFLDGQYSQGDNPDYYDDIVLYKMWGKSLLWETSPLDDKNIYNASLGNVGIGTNDPQNKLDVEGDIRALGDLNTIRICNQEGKSCFDPDVIGGEGMKCVGANKVMVGIKDSTPICENISIKDPDTQACPDGQFSVGINLLGELICVTPYWIPGENDINEVTLP